MSRAENIPPSWQTTSDQRYYEAVMELHKYCSNLHEETRVIFPIDMENKAKV